MSQEKILGWHFLRADRRLGCGDGRAVVDGEVLTYTGDEPPECCARGMHASPEVWQALHYAPGAVLCRVEVSGDIHHQDDKFTGRRRLVVWSADAATVLPLVVEFARWCADRAAYAHAAAAAHADADAVRTAAHIAATRAARPADAADSWHATDAADAAAAHAVAVTAAHAAAAARAAAYAASAAYAAAWYAASAAYAAWYAARAAAATAERRVQSDWWTERLRALGAPV